MINMSDKKTIRKGSSDFKNIIEDNGYFVDKTMLVKDFFENGSYTMLMPRPKRFGKTLNLSMIEYFFDIRKADSKSLFTEFEIAKETVFCQKHQNKYPVINITLKDIDETNWVACFESFKTIISTLYRQHKYLLESDKIEVYEKERINDFILRTANAVDYKFSIQYLSECLNTHFDEKVIILVDEYDAPIINAYTNSPKPIINKNGSEPTYYQNVINFMQTFLGSAFKGNDNNLKKGLLTGVMRIGRESIFSKWNNFEVYGITSTYFADKFGFTQKEIEKLLAYFDLEANMTTIAKWYNGYKFGDVTQIYNPWSIVSYILNKNDGCKPYWVNTSDDSLIKERIAVENIKNAIVELINNNTITKTIKENFVFADFEHNTELIWTLLFNSGFITPIKKVSLFRYEFRIPNYELKFVFTNLILEWIGYKYKFNQDLLITTSNYLTSNNIAEFETGFKQILSDTLSYFDIYGKDASTERGPLQKEHFFHVYTLGLLAVLSDDYIIRSNRESGEGRYDIVLIPRNVQTGHGIIIEIKHIKNQQENETYDTFTTRINAKIDEAIEQIERKKYYKELLAHKVELNRIIRVPIVFAGKEPYMKKHN